MEPFSVTLQQVTFEEGDLSTSQELDSFSNIVHYDYDKHFPQTAGFASTSITSSFSFTQSNGLPVGRPELKKKVTNYKRPAVVAQPSRVKTSQIYSQSISSPLVSPPHHHSLINPHSSFVDSAGFITRKTDTQVSSSDIRTLFQVSSNTIEVKKKVKLKPPAIMSNSDSGIAVDSPVPGQDEGQSFETVAEALHLQWSVIGDKNLTPVSPDVVAQVVAEAQKKIKATGTVTHTVSQTPLPSATEYVQDTAMMRGSPVTSLSEDVPSALSYNNTSNHVANGGVESMTPPLQNVKREADQNFNASNSNKSVIQNLPTSKELIHIPAENIIRTRDKPSWFGSSQPHTYPVKENKMASSEDLKSLSEADHDSISEDREDIQSVSSSTSELESFGQSETDKFLKSLPPIKQIDLSAILPKSQAVRSFSPPVKETSFRPVIQTSYKPANTTSSKVDQENLDSTAKMTDSGVSLNGDHHYPDFTTSNLVTSTPNSKSHFVMPQLEPLFLKSQINLSSSQKKSAEAVYKSKSVNKESDKQLEEVLREKAKLEGKLEMLGQEAQNTLQERAELQADVSSLKQKLKANQDMLNDQEKDNLRKELDKLKKSKHLLEQSLGSAHKFLEEKNNDAKIMQEELDVTQDVNQKLQLKVKEIRDDLRGKEMTIQALKNKIAELYVEVNTVLQAKMEADNESRSARNDLVALINTKDWYQQQLQAAQEARTKLQSELTNLQAQASSQGTIIEKLKTENAKLRQQVKDVQQQAIKDKETLAKHLEKIEADMMQRESAFQEIQREKMLYENTFDSKLKSVENEKHQAKSLMHMTSELEGQLDKSQESLKHKQSQIITLENEQIDLMKKLALSQENVIEKDHMINELQEKLIEVESGVKAFRKGMEDKEKEIWKLKEEKASVEISLNAALQEKLSVDRVLESLKGDMGKVEKSFRSMKQELGNKSVEYDSLRKEKNDLQDEVEQVRVELDKEKKESQLIQRDSESKVSSIDDMRNLKVKFEEEVKYLKEEVRLLESKNNDGEKEKTAIEKELASVQEKLVRTEEELHRVIAELENYKSVEQESKQNSQVSDMESNQTLSKENEDLKDAMKKLEKQHQKDFTKQKAKVVRLNQDLKSMQNELTDRQASFDSNVEMLSSKLREVTADKERLETELDMAHRKHDFGMIQQQDHLTNELQTMASELENAKLHQQALENQLYEMQRIKEMEVQEYQKHLTAINDELSHQRETQANSEEQEVVNQKLSLELEKEKGRVSGLMQTNASLKHHVSELEGALARRESVLVELQTQTQEAITEKEKEGEECHQRIKSLEEEMIQEKKNQRDLRKQIGTKITENKKIRRHLNNATAEKENLVQDLQHRVQETDSLRAELDNSKQLQQVQTGQLNTLDTENKELVHQLDIVKRELSDNLAREPIIQEQIASLQWQLDQKCKEIEAVQNQALLSEQRQEIELNDLRNTIQSQLSELDNLRQDLSDVRQEKSVHQTEMAQLRATLKASLQHHKLTKKLNKNSNYDNEDGEITTKETGTQVEDRDAVIIPPLPFDLEVVEKLVQDSTVKALESKPLDNLQTCLSSLRSEITGLQKQMDDHMTTVEVSTQSWSTVESQVNELRHIMQTMSTTTPGNLVTDSLSSATVDTDTKSGAVFDI